MLFTKYTIVHAACVLLRSVSECAQFPGTTHTHTQGRVEFSGLANATLCNSSIPLSASPIKKPKFALLVFLLCFLSPLLLPNSLFQRFRNGSSCTPTLRIKRSTWPHVLRFQVEQCCFDTSVNCWTDSTHAKTETVRRTWKFPNVIVTFVSHSVYKQRFSVISKLAGLAKTTLFLEAVTIEKPVWKYSGWKQASNVRCDCTFVHMIFWRLQIVTRSSLACN